MHPGIFKFNVQFFPQSRTHRKAYRDIRTGGLRRFVHSVVRSWQRRRMVAALESLNDNLLHDLGISRNNIPGIVQTFTDRELGMRPVSEEVERQSTRSSCCASRRSLTLGGACLRETLPLLHFDRWKGPTK